VITIGTASEFDWAEARLTLPTDAATANDADA